LGAGAVVLATALGAGAGGASAVGADGVATAVGVDAVGVAAAGDAPAPVEATWHAASPKSKKLLSAMSW
jgi:hypothetical protein